MTEIITSVPKSQPKRRRRKRRIAKPDKPYPDFPLFPHATKRWAKKIRGRLVYFGPWSDPDAAMAKYLDQKDDLFAGRVPRSHQQDGVTVDELVNRFLVAKRDKRDAGRLSPHTYRDYVKVCLHLTDTLGRNTVVKELVADDFRRLLRKCSAWGLVAQGNMVNRVRVVFKWGCESGLYDQMPRYGPDFKRPSKKELRLVRARKGPRMFEAAELRTILAAAKQPLKAMILLGINCGFGNADCGRLPLSALDLDRGWCNYHREKTGITRRCPLWPETVAALREAIDQRPKPKDEALADRVFITVAGGSWYKDTADNPVSKETRKLLDKLGINGERNFYTLRHTFRTVADESRDQPAIDHIMGHESPHMASVYRERISDQRLRDVAEHVHKWAFGE